MGRWEFFSQSAAIIRRHPIALALAILPALIATYVVDSVFQFHRILPSQFLQRPLYYASVKLVLQLLQFFLGWLFLTFEFGVVADYVSTPMEHRTVSVSIEKVREHIFELTKLSWGIYWRMILAFIPLFLLVLFTFSFVVNLVSKIGHWAGDVETVLAFSMAALFVSKWLLAIPHLILAPADARSSLRSAKVELQVLHEPILAFSLLFVFVGVFATVTWPKLLQYVYIPAEPEWSVRLIQKWIAPATSIMMNLWATMMLFVGTTVLWLNREHFKQEETVDAHSLHR